MGTGALQRRRLGLYLAVAFGQAWLVAAGLSATGGLTDSPVVVRLGGASLTLASVALPTAYMFAPAVGTVVTRTVTDEGIGVREMLLDVDPTTWRSYLAAWLVPPALTVAGAAAFYAVFPEHLDPSFAAYADRVAVAADGPVDFPAGTLVAIQVAAALSLGTLLNCLFAAGEEVGWRGYLLPKLLPLGVRRAVVLHGLIWGVWHWPLIAMGYEYGFDYPGAPWAGPPVFLAFAVSAGTLLAWLTLRSGSVWPATLAHAAVNATAGFGVFVLRGDPNPLLGPLPIGLVGGLPWLLVALVLLVRIDGPRRLSPRAGVADRGPDHGPAR